MRVIVFYSGSPMQYSNCCFTSTFSVVMKSTEKMLKYIVWERNYTSPIWLILLFYPFTVRFKKTFYFSSLSKEERERCRSHRQDYPNGVENMPV